MHPGASWYVLSSAAFVVAIITLLVSAGVFMSIIGKLAPLLTESKSQIQDLGDLAANTVGRAAQTMEIVELRVAQTMGQATQAGKAATRQALGMGTGIAGLYLASRFVGLLRDAVQRTGEKRHRGRRRFLIF